MAITLQCSRCTHEQKIDDSKAGQEVTCKICHHLIKVGSVATPSVPTPAPKEKKASPDGVKAGAPGVLAGAEKKTKTEQVTQVAPKPKAAKDKSPADDDESPMPRIKRSKEESTGMLSIVIAGAVVLVVVLMCGGLGMGGLYLFRPSPVAEEPLAQGPAVPIQDDRNGNEPKRDRDPNPPNQNPPAKQKDPIPNIDPFPKIDPFPNPPPPKENLGAGDPKDIDRVVAILKGPAPERAQAFGWLNAADPKHPRRAELAQLIDGMVIMYLNEPPALGNDGLFDSYFKWVTKDNVPTLIRVAASDRFTVWDNRYRQESMRLLGKFQDARAAETIVKKLSNGFDGGVAFEALMEMGPVAEASVVPFLNDVSFPGAARESARKLVKAYNTRPDVLIDQCIKDLDSPDGNRRGAALQWIAQADVNKKRKADVSNALNKSIESEGSLRNKDLIVCLEKYGTKENAKKLVQILEANRLGAHETIRSLGKLRDPDGIRAVAGHLGNFFNRTVARDVLKECRGLAEPAVIEVMTTTPDRNCRMECVKLLGDIGTSKSSVPALRKVGQFFAQDGQLGAAAQKSITAITARGG